jgi:Uma2 family endonuclease
MALQTAIKFTYADYKHLPESETRRYELLGGELVMVPSPDERHQRSARNLGFILWEYIHQQELGAVYYAPFDVVLSTEHVVQPDILFVSAERAHIITEDNVQGAPDLVIEILSPTTAGRDRTYKRTLYARYGVREYWLVDPMEGTVEVLTLGERGFERAAEYGRDEVLRSSLLQGLKIDLREVF